MTVSFRFLVTLPCVAATLLGVPSLGNRANAALPRVLLIGDSISQGYTGATRKKLAGKAEVHRVPANCGSTVRSLKSIDDWLGDERWDVIHFNWGIHDVIVLDVTKNPVTKKPVQLATPIDEYEKNLVKLVRRLKRTGATLIWCSTTPAGDGLIKHHRNEDVVAYNAVAKKIMDAEKIAVDDLHAFALPKLREIQSPDGCHFTREGSAVLADQVTASIVKELRKEYTKRHRHDEDFVVTWQVSGPYFTEGRAWPDNLDDVYPPEKRGAEEVAWKAVRAKTDDVLPTMIVNLENLLGGDDRVAYLRNNVRSDKQRTVLLELGSDDGIKVWINDELVHVNKIRRGVRPGDDLVKVTLRKGVNTVMLKIAQAKYGWGACMRIRNLDGSKLEGVNVELSE